MIEFMIEKACANSETPDYALKIIKSIAKTVADGRVPTAKQYAVIYRNFRRADRSELQELYAERKREEG